MNKKSMRLGLLPVVLLPVAVVALLARPAPQQLTLETPAPRETQTMLASPMPTLAPLVAKVEPAVVNISVVGHVQTPSNPLFEDPFFRRFFGAPSQPSEQEFEAAGSGVIVDSHHGYILTNNHVIDKADQIQVSLADNRELEAKLVGADPEVDLAVIQIKPDDLTAIPLGDSDDLQVGDYVVAVGNPFHLGHTVTAGIISALGRSSLGIEGYEDFIQTDAAINPGNSGGALVDLHGNLIGINTAIAGPNGSNVGIGFAIPINMARTIMTQLIEHGEVRRGQLGVLVQDITPDLATAMHLDVSSGAIVARVEPKSAAERAGIKVGDVIVKVNGEQVRDAAHLRNMIGLMEIDHKFNVELIRDGKAMTITAELTPLKYTRTKGEDLDKRLSGTVFGVVEGQGPGTHNLEVVEIDTDSNPYRAGLRKGDIIIAVNRQSVDSVAQLEQVLSEPSDALLFQVQRGDAAVFLVIE
ncbi:MAG: DegQ family serine endoprotease [Gemmatimonadales bacterium]|jgi:serine protease Do/serine protease DegQ